MSHREDRGEAIAEIAELLPQRTSQLSRLLWRHARGPLHRGMASLLATLGEGQQTISRLAELEGVAQPTLTRMVERLEASGLARKQRSEADGRLVRVELTPHGVLELAALRSRYQAVLTERLSNLSDRQLDELRAASDAVQGLIAALREDAPEQEPR
jgi:DNA-binding MarR family transcriptional regulator